MYVYNYKWFYSDIMSKGLCLEIQIRVPDCEITDQSNCLKTIKSYCLTADCSITGTSRSRPVNESHLPNLTIKGCWSNYRVVRYNWELVSSQTDFLKLDLYLQQ